MDEQGTVLMLAPTLDATAAFGLAEALRAAVGRPVALEAGGVTRVGGACLQVLLSAQERWRADGVAWRVDHPTEAFASWLRVLGADALLAEEAA